MDPQLLSVSGNGLVGEGNFAVVYTGVYNGQKVAVKILHNVEATEDLWQEAATLEYAI